MKKVITLLFLLAAGASLRAQILAGSSSLDPSSVMSVDRGLATADAHAVSPVYRQTYAAPLHITKFSIPGEKKKKVGSVMTVLGGALIIGGVAVYASGDPDYYRETYNQSTNTTTVETIDPKQVLGVFMAVVGTSVAVPGVIIWTKGIRQYNQYMKEQGETGPLRLGVGNGGAVLSYRF